MTLINTGVELASMGPGVLGFQVQGVGNTIRVGGAMIGAAGTLFYSLFRAFNHVPEGYVGIRTFNGRALDKKGEPLHPLLEPGGHWMVPFLHDVDLVNRQHQTTLIETTVDVPHPQGFEQYKLGAVATWGVRSSQSGIRPIVSFEDAYKHFYGIDTSEDLEEKVAAVATRYLIDCVLELDEGERTIDVLNSYAEENISDCMQGLDSYGAGIHAMEVTEFSHSGVIQMGASTLNLRVTSSLPETAGHTAHMN